MKNKIRKISGSILSFALAAAMVIGMSGTATFAADANADDSDSAAEQTIIVKEQVTGTADTSFDYHIYEITKANKPIESKSDITSYEAGADLSYIIYDTSTGEALGTETTDGDGGFSLSAEEYAEFTVAAETDWYVEQDTPDEYPLTSVTADGDHASVVDSTYGVVQYESEPEPTPTPSVDKDALQAAYDEGIALNASDYTADSWAPFETALEQAKTVLDDDNATQEDVDKALENLEKAKEGLEKAETVDKSKLQEEVNEDAPLVDKKDDYTPGSWEAFEKALDKALEVLNDNDANQKQVDDALADLKEAKEGLTEKADKTELQKEYDEDSSLKEDDYTAESWKPFADAMDQAKEVLDNDDATQEEVDEALKTLQDAKDGLEKVPEPTPALTVNVEVSSDLTGNTKSYDGNGVTLTATATATPDTAKVSYQWYGPDGKAIEGATDSTLSIDGKVSDSGAYKCEVTATNDGETATGEGTITITIEKAAQDISYAETTIEKTVGDEPFTNELTETTVSPEEGAGITYTSSDESIATVDENGEVTILAKGTVIITATAAETADYAEATATYVINVSEPAPAPVVDKSVLQKEYDEDSTLVESDYTPESWAPFEKALEAAKDVLDDENATQEEVDDALEALLSAKEGLEPASVVDKSALQKEYDEDSALVESDYTPDSWALFETALEQAKTVLDDDNATQEEVDEALADLQKAKEGLTEKADKDVLQKEYDKDSALVESDYTPESWAPFETALQQAKDVLDDENATQKEVDDALETLISARDALEKVPEPVQPTVSVTVKSTLEDNTKTYDGVGVSLTATAEATPDTAEVSYQWYTVADDGTETPIEGKTSNLLNLDGNVSDSGTYKCVVTATNDGLTATASDSITITINAAAQDISYAATTVEKTYGDAAFTNPLTETTVSTEEGAGITYKSSDETIAKVDENGEVTILAAGEVTITATAAATANYKEATASYTITIAKAIQDISYATTLVTKYKYEDDFTNELTKTLVFGEITYTSSDESVATVDASTGEVSIEGTGHTTITATAAGSDNYTEATASYVLVVNSDNIEWKVQVNGRDQKWDDEKQEYVDDETYNGKPFELEMVITLTAEQEEDLDEITYQWYRYDTEKQDFDEITGATDSKYTVDGDYLNAGDYLYMCSATVTFKNTDADTVHGPIEITIEKIAQEISYETTELNKTVGDEPFTNDLTETVVSTEEGAGITYSSSDESIATVDENGKVTILKDGTVTITATAVETTNYTEASASYTIKIVANKTALQEEYDEDSKLNEDDYTAASWAPFKEALENAKTVLDDDDATQAEVDAALSALQDAKAGLKEKVPPTVSDVTITSSIPDNTKTYDGIGVSLTVTATVTPDTAEVTYQWYKDGEEIDGATYSLLNIDGNVSNSGTYKCVVTATNDGLTETADAEITITINAAAQDISYAETTVEKTYGDAAFTNTLTETTVSTETGAGITYTSSDEKIATVDENGEVTILAVGEVTITATAAATANYEEATASYTLTIAKAAQDISYAETTVEKTYGDAAFTNPLTETTVSTETGAGITYKSSDEKIATVDENGEVTILAVGEVTITATAAATASYEEATASYTITIAKATQDISYAKSVVAKNDGDDNFTNELTKTLVFGEITYTSSDESVATVDASTGEVSIKGTGQTTITATAAGSDNYTEATAAYVLTVNPAGFEWEIDVDGEKATWDEDMGEYTDSVTYTGDSMDLKVVITESPDEKGDVDTITYQWYRFNPYVMGLIELDGETEDTLTLQDEEVNAGDFIYVCVATVTYKNGLSDDLFCTIELTIEKAEQEISYAQTEVTKDVGEDAFTIELTETKLSTDKDAGISYTSSDESVATVDENGKVTIVGIGETTITATAVETTNFKEASASYALTVKDHAWGNVTWTWADDYSSATASRTCTICGKEETAEASQITHTTTATATEAGQTTYTATATFEDGTAVTGTETVDTPAIDPDGYITIIDTTGKSSQLMNTTIDAAIKAAPEQTFTYTSHGETNSVTKQFVLISDLTGITDFCSYTVTASDGYSTSGLPADTYLYWRDDDECYRTAVNDGTGSQWSNGPVTIELVAHTWGNVTWTWAADYSSATASHTCSVCGYTETVTATVTSEETTEPRATKPGEMTYTATATFGDGTTATDTETEEIAPLDPDGYITFVHGDDTWTISNADLDKAIDEAPEQTFTYHAHGSENTLTKQYVLISELSKIDDFCSYTIDASDGDHQPDMPTDTYLYWRDGEGGGYFRTAVDGGQGYQWIDKPTTITIIDHTWDNDDVTWDWAEDYSSATATRTCTVCKATETADATEITHTTTATATEAGQTTYTATATFKDGTEVTGETTVDTPAIDPDGYITIIDTTGKSSQLSNATIDAAIKAAPEQTFTYTSRGSENSVTKQFVLISDLTGITDFCSYTVTASDGYSTDGLPADTYLYWRDDDECYRTAVNGGTGSQWSNGPVTIELVAHTWGNVTWDWAEDYSSATASHTCSVCNTTETVNATITSEQTKAPRATEEGETTYTATATFGDGTTATDTETEEIAPLDPDGYINIVYNGETTQLMYTTIDEAIDKTDPQEFTYTTGKGTNTLTEPFVLISDLTGITDVCSYTIEASDGDTQTGMPADTYLYWRTDRLYFRTAVNNGEGNQWINEPTTITIVGHTWDNTDITWDWATDYSTATATRKCSVCGATETVNAVITTAKPTEGETVYTATATFSDGTVVTNEKTVETEEEAFAVYIEDEQNLTFAYGTAPEAGGTYDGKTVTKVYDDVDTTVAAEATDVPWNEVSADVTTVTIDESFKTAKPTSTELWFNGFAKATFSGLANMDTSEVTNMYCMFDNCASATSFEGVSEWDTSKVTSTRFMFENCSALTSIDISDWNVSSLTTAEGMFNGSSLTSVGLSWTTSSSLTSMRRMFRNCTGLTEVNLTGCDASAVTTMYQMFNGCTNLESINLTGVDTTSVTDNNATQFATNCPVLNHVVLGEKTDIFTRAQNVDQQYWYDKAEGEADATLASSDYLQSAAYPGEYWSYSKGSISIKVGDETSALSYEAIDAAIAKATEDTFTYGNGNSVTAKFVLLSDLIGIDYDFCSYTVTGSDGTVQAGLPTDTYLYKRSDTGVYRTAVKGGRGNQWRDDPTTIEVITDHTWGDVAWTWNGLPVYATAAADATEPASVMPIQPWNVAATLSIATLADDADTVTATATRTCSVCNKTETVDAEVTSAVTTAPTERVGGLDTYTATATFSDSSTDTDTKTRITAATGSIDVVYKKSTGDETGTLTYAAVTAAIDETEPFELHYSGGDLTMPFVSIAKLLEINEEDFCCFYVADRSGDEYNAVIPTGSYLYQRNDNYRYRSAVADGERDQFVYDLDYIEVRYMHDWNVEWTWADDYSSATATATCTVCGATDSVTTTDIETTTEGGNTVYTATATLSDGTVVTDTKTASETDTYNVKYAVSIWGISQDVDADGDTLALTFGPATGKSYVSSSESHLTEAQVEAGDGYCIHWMDWADIADVCATTPNAFKDCLDNGCTKAVELNLNTTLLGTSYAGKMDNGDGAGMLLDSITNIYQMWDEDWPAEGGWPASRVRATLNGRDDDTDAGVAGDQLLITDNCLFSCFPEELQNVIVAKAVKSDTDGSGSIKATNDKLWLFSGVETWGEGSDNDAINSNEGTLYTRSTNLGITTSAAAGLANSNEEGSTKEWWTRTINEDGYSLFSVNTDGTPDEVYDPSEYGYGLAPGFCIGVQTAAAVETTDITVTKEWTTEEDAYKENIPESVEIALLANGEAAKDADGNAIDALTLTAADEWTGTFKDVPVTTESGEDITYTVEETSTDALFVPEVTGDATNGFTITNHEKYFDLDEEILPEDEDPTAQETVSAYEPIEIEMTTNLPYIDGTDLLDGGYTILFHDQLDEGLVVDKNTDDFKVTIGGIEVESNYYTVTIGNSADPTRVMPFAMTLAAPTTTLDDDCAFHVEVDLAALYDDNVINDDDLTGKTELTLYFYADLEGDTLAGNYNSTAWYEVYDKAQDVQYTSDKHVVTATTYGIEITKIDSADNSPLAGATLGVYSDEDCKTPVQHNDKDYTLESGENGKVVFGGLAPGTYYVKETVVPSGYMLSSTVLTADLTTLGDDTYMFTGEYANDLGYITIINGDSTTQLAYSDIDAAIAEASENTFTYNSNSVTAKFVLISDLIGIKDDFCSYTVTCADDAAGESHAGMPTDTYLYKNDSGVFRTAVDGGSGRQWLYNPTVIEVVTEHDWGEVKWTWDGPTESTNSTDHLPDYTATATRTCTACSKEETATATVTKDTTATATQPGTTTYTATATFDGDTEAVTDTKDVETDAIDAEGSITFINGDDTWTISNADIDAALAEADTITVTNSSGTAITAKMVKISDLTKITEFDSYTVTCSDSDREFTDLPTDTYLYWRTDKGCYRTAAEGGGGRQWLDEPVTIEIIGAKAATTPTVNYAVKIYGIQEDTYSTDGGETTQKAGLTFGPALGANYLNDSKSCTAEYCIHNMTWEQIIAQCAENPSVFESCKENGCTKAVELTPNGTLFNMTTVANAAAKDYTGDGVSELFYLLNCNESSSYDRGATWNPAYANSSSDPSNIYSRSWIRTMLTGDQENIKEWMDAGGHTDYYGYTSELLCNEGNCLLSCFPTELQEAVVPRTTENAGSPSGYTSAGDVTTYDKLFLFSAKELGISWTLEDGGGTNYGIASTDAERCGYEFGDTTASGSGTPTYWTRSREAMNYMYATYVSSSAYTGSLVTIAFGVAPGFSLPGPAVEEPTVSDITIDATAEGTGLDENNTKTYDGEGITLTASATVSPDDATVTYTWYKDDVEIPVDEADPTALATTTTSTLKLDGNVSDSGTYKCEVTVENTAGSDTKTSNEITITINKADQTIVFTDGNEVTKETSVGTYTNALDEDESVVKGDLSYVSSNTEVATVDNDGLVTILGAGETTITATAAETDNYKSVEASYTLTVTKPATVNYAVKIYGIQADKYLEEDGETLGTAGLTFGPATGESYLKNSVSCDSNTCIHNMTWDEIIAQSEEDPGVFKSCLENGCTKAVELTPNSYLFDMTVVNNAAAQNYTGDGVSTLYYLLSADATNRYGYWNLTGGYGTPDSDPANVYSRSRIRTTLTGDRSNIDTWLAADSSHSNYYYSDTYPLLDESYSLFSCFPSELQEAIVSRETVSGGRGVNTGHTYPDTSYDKLWLFSLAEVGISSDYDDAGGTDYGTAKENSDRIAYEFSSANATSSGGCAWWTRSRHSNSTYNMWDVTESGDSSSRYCYYQYGISPGFCLAGPEVVEPEVTGVTVTSDVTEKTYDGSGITLTATVEPEGADVTYQWYSPDDEEIADATSSEYTTGANVSDSGTYKCVVTASDNSSAEGTIEITITKATQSIEFTDESVEKAVGDDKFTNAITEDSVVFGDVTYSTGDETVATVDETTGEVTIVGAGETEITATAAGDTVNDPANYDSVSASYTLTVTEPEPVTVNYAVKIYGIGVDKYSEDGGETTKDAGLTFGPALGTNYVSSYKAHLTGDDYNAGTNGVCLHWMTWEEIIAQNEEDPHAFDACLTNGCTKAVALTTNDTLFNMTTVNAAQSYNGDGVATLYYLLGATTSRNLYWNLTTSGYSADDPANVYSRSRIRTFLTGDSTDMEAWIAEGHNNYYYSTTYPLLTEETCLFTCFPEELQEAIVPRETVNGGHATSSSATKYEEKETYDKLWLFSMKELGFDLSYDDTGGTDYGVNGGAYDSDSKLAYEFSDANASRATYQNWWSRSRYSGNNQSYWLASGSYHNGTVDNAEGISPGFCLPGSTAAEPEVPTVSGVTITTEGLDEDNTKTEDGNEVTLTATATVTPEGLEPTYQWSKDGTELEGKTEATLTLAGEVSDSGTYECVVTAENSAGKASDSAEITITINEATTSSDTVKYAVKIWGIGTDKDEEGNTLGLTFGPALGTDYTKSSKSHLTEEQYEAGAGKCIHWMTWEEIIETDPNEFADCKTNGCTKAVELTPNEKLFNPTVVAAAQDYITGDGVTTLYRLLAGEGSYSYGAIWNYGYSGANTSDPANVYSKSRIRVTLNGDATDAELKYASSDGTGSDLCNENTCLLSCFPEVLQEAIAPRETVNAGLLANWYTSYGDKETYDKLWLPSSIEAGTTFTSSNEGNYDGGGTSYGVNSSMVAYEFNSDASSSSKVNWWSRSRNCSGYNSAFYFSTGDSGTSSSTITYGYGVSPCFSLPAPASAEAQPTVADVKILTDLDDNATSKTYDGEGITLNVSATTSPDDATVSYQWYKDGTEVVPTSLMPSEMLVRPYAMAVQPYATSTSSYTTGANVSDSGTYTCKVTVSSGDSEPAEAEGSIDISIEKATQSIEFTDGEEVTKATSDGTYTNAITEDSVVFGEVTYDSSNKDVATVDEKGEVTILAAGETTITATAAGDTENNPANYESVSASYKLTVTGEEASTTWTKVQYAVKIWGIGKDTYSTDGGSTTGSAVTFGPAFGADYTNSYVSRETVDEEKHESEYCIHDMTWDAIIAQCAEDPTVFQNCLDNGCTKAVELTPNTTIFNSTTVNNALAENFTGDGVSTLYSLLSSDYATWNQSYSENLYSASRIRITLNGDSSDAGSAAGSGLCDSSNCLLSCFPSELQSAIVPRETVNAGTPSQGTSAGDKTTYDKLFLFSESEVGETPTYDDCGGVDYGLLGANDSTGRTAYEFSSSSSTSSASAQYWWTRSRVSNSTSTAYYMGTNGYGATYTVWFNLGVSPAFCIPGASSSGSEPDSDTDSYNVKYAVSVWGIQQDKDESGNTLGLTFGPATGANYTSSYESRETAGNDHPSTYCIHDMTWAEIIAQSKENPEVFEDCLENGCTKAVNLTLNGTLLDEDNGATDYAGKMDDGDGAGMLYNCIASDYRKWNDVSTAQTGTTGGYPASRIRATLNGADDLTDKEYAGSDVLDESNCLLSCFPKDLQDGIVAKAVQTGTVWSSQTEENAKITYDKLWPFSGAEVYGSGSSNSIIHSYEGSLYTRSSEFFITTSNYHDLANYEETGSASHRWWLRTIPTSGGSIANNVMASGDWSSTTVTDPDKMCGLAFGFCLS